MTDRRHTSVIAPGSGLAAVHRAAVQLEASRVAARHRPGAHRPGRPGSSPRAWALGAASALAPAVAATATAVAVPAEASTAVPAATAAAPVSAHASATPIPSTLGAGAAGQRPVASQPAGVTTPATTSQPPQQVTAPVLRRGSRGEAVRAAQQRLADLGYWLGEVDGSFGPVTQQAVLALQKAAGLERDGVLGPRTRAALDAGVRPEARGSGDLVEIDKRRQLLLVVRGGEVVTVLNTSTGTEQPYEEDGLRGVADTPPGTWQVGWAFDGLREARLGELHRPRYFHPDGIAVHGADYVPAYPASHGCVRVSDAAMDMVWERGLMPVGSTVLVHEG